MRIKGFALLEFVLAIVCTGVLTLIASSVFGALAGTSRVAAVRSGLADSIEQAHQYAAEHASTVWLCPSREGFACEDDNDWSHGWMGFADRNGNARFDEGDELLHKTPPLLDGLRLCSARRQTRIRFRPLDGRPDSAVAFTLCDLRCPQEAVVLALTDEGRISERPASPRAAQDCQLE